DILKTFQRLNIRNWWLMVRFWNTVARWFSSSRVIKTEGGKTLLACGGCGSDVVLHQFHWCHPSGNEDIAFWRCPPCVNRARVAKGLAPLGRDGRAILN